MAEQNGGPIWAKRSARLTTVDDLVGVTITDHAHALVRALRSAKHRGESLLAQAFSWKDRTYDSIPSGLSETAPKICSRRTRATLIR